MKVTFSTARVLFQPLLIGLVAALVVRATLFQAFSIPSASMSPTLQPGDHILVTPTPPFLPTRAPERGEVVVFRNPAAGPGYFVKRVIAVAGDHLEIRDGHILLNSGRLDERYVNGERSEGMVAEIIPAGYVFVMGDHRSDSIDSRSWGLLETKKVVGRARLIFWSSASVGASSASAHSATGEPVGPRGPRWDRIFRIIR
ncbi:MAG: signal peptidase I [Thermoanaerobaculia bacterium]